MLSKLDAIAPTFVYDSSGQGGDWKTGFKQVSEILQKEDLAENLLSDYDDAMNLAKGKSEGVRGKTFSFGAAMADGKIILVSTGNEMFENLGLQKSKSQAKVSSGDSTSGSYVPETYGNIDGDFIILTPRGADREEFSKSSAFRIVEDRVRWDESNVSYSINSGGVLAKIWLPENMVEMLNVANR